MFILASRVPGGIRNVREWKTGRAPQARNRSSVGAEKVWFGERACPLPNRLGDLEERRELTSLVRAVPAANNSSKFWGKRTTMAELET